MSKSMTKSQLTIELANLRAHVARREVEWNAAQAELKALKAPRIPVPEVTERPMSTFQLACLRAREMALRTGRAVRVGG